MNIRELIAMNRALPDRLCMYESALLRLPVAGKTAHARTEDDQAQQEAPVVKRRKKAAPSNLPTVWYQWYTQIPRGVGGWDSMDRQRKSDSRLLVAHLKLFLPSGFVIVDGAPSFKDDILALVTTAQTAALDYHRGHSVTGSGAGTILKALRRLHREGLLDEKTAAHKRLLARNKIVDPSPLAAQYILAFASLTGL